MATSTFLRDYLGRALVNGNPGVTDPVLDFIGRLTQAGNVDFIGRDLAQGPVTAWTVSTAYAVGDLVKLTGLEILEATVAGTSDATTEPTPPGVGNSVVDGTVTWLQIR